jgi:hypothetical protein
VQGCCPRDISDVVRVENDLNEDLELQSELGHALDVLIDKHENVKMPSQSNVKSIVAHV